MLNPFLQELKRRGLLDPAEYPPQKVSRPSVVKRSQENQLAGLKALLDAEGNFVWTKTPEADPRGRGLYPTLTWVMAWYDGALGFGYQPEDIGFYPHDLYEAWHDFVEEHWPGDKRNNFLLENVTFEHRMPFDADFVFPG